MAEAIWGLMVDRPCSEHPRVNARIFALPSRPKSKLQAKPNRPTNRAAAPGRRILELLMCLSSFRRSLALLCVILIMASACGRGTKSIKPPSATKDEAGGGPDNCVCLVKCVSQQSCLGFDSSITRSSQYRAAQVRVKLLSPK